MPPPGRQMTVPPRLAPVPALHRLPSLPRGVVIVPVATLLQRLLPRHYMDQQTLLLDKGERLELERLRGRLDQAGYRCVSQVVEHGEFAVRGSLLDLYPMGSALPFRIDLLDEEVESIRTFDPETQRSVDQVERIRLLPAREFPLDEAAIARFRQGFRSRFEGDPNDSLIYRDVSQGIAPAGIEYYLPLFFETTATLFDYLPADALLVIDEPATVPACIVFVHDALDHTVFAEVVGAQAAVLLFSALGGLLADQFDDRVAIEGRGSGAVGGRRIGIATGLGWTAIVGLAYRQRAARRFSGSIASLIFYGAFLALFAWQVNEHQAEDLAAMQAPVAVRLVDREAWWAGEWQALPRNRTRLASVAARPFNAQMAADLEVISEKLAPSGWEPVPETDWRWIVQALNPEPDQASLPLLGRAYLGRSESLLLRKNVEPDGRLLADRVYRALFSSFDHALREEGVGDSSIARKMRKMGEEFFGLARAMDEAIESEAAEDMLTHVLKRKIQSDEAKARALAHFVLETDRAMSALSDTQARSGQVTAETLST